MKKIHLLFFVSLTAVGFAQNKQIYHIPFSSMTARETASEFAVRDNPYKDSMMVEKTVELETWQPWSAAAKSIIVFYKHRNFGLSVPDNKLMSVFYLPVGERYAVLPMDNIGYIKTNMTVEDVFFANFDNDTVPEIGVLYSFPATGDCRGTEYMTMSYKKPYILDLNTWEPENMYTMYKTIEARFRGCDCVCGEQQQTSAAFKDKQSVISELLKN